MGQGVESYRDADLWAPIWQAAAHNFRVRIANLAKDVFIAHFATGWGLPATHPRIQPNVNQILVLRQLLLPEAAEFRRPN